MSDYDAYLDDHHEMISEMVRDFAESEIAPVAWKHDEEESFPWENAAAMAELGLFGIPIPEEYGGVGLDLLESCIVVEELAWGCAGMATSIMCNDLGLTPVLLGGKNSSWFTEQIYNQFITRYNWEAGATFGVLLLLFTSLVVWIGLRLTGQSLATTLARAGISCRLPAWSCASTPRQPPLKPSD